MLHRGIVRPSEVFAVQNYRTGVPVASKKAARYRTLATGPYFLMPKAGSDWRTPKHAMGVASSVAALWSFISY